MASTFDPIDYVSSLTVFPFDRAHLKRVANETGIAEATAYSEVTDEQKDKAEIALLKLVVYGPYSSASYKDKHGDFERQVGSYTITSAMLEQAKARLRRLLQKWDLTDDVEELDDAGGCLQWINEYD